MRSFYLVTIADVLFLTSCSNITKPSDVNFTRAINQYLAKHGEACTAIDRQFPIVVSQSEQQYGIGPKLAALEQAGMMHASDATAVVHGMLDPLRGSTPPQPVKRYELTADGKQYFQQSPGTLGQTSGFCYGQKSVDAIVRWTEPAIAGTHSQIEVTYTYKLVKLAGWAENRDVQRAFPMAERRYLGNRGPFRS